MSKFSVFIIIIFLTALAIFAIYNQQVTTIKIPFGKAYETPTIALVLLSGSIGAFAMLIIFVIRDTKRYVNNLQYQKKQKKDTKIQELHSKALNYFYAHHNPEEAKKLLEEILAEDPENLNALIKLGDIYSSQGEYIKAKEYYQRARDVQPNNIDVLFSLEQLMERTERWTDAIRYLDEILDIDDENLNALYAKREILERLERWDELVLIQKVILKSEKSEKERKNAREALVGYKYEYGRYSLENGELEKAKKAFRTVLRLEKDFVPATLGLAEVLIREGETEDAINLLEKSFEENLSMIILQRLEDLLISVGEPLRLIRIYKNAISREPDNINFKLFLGKLFYRLEMIDDAFDTLTTIDTGGVIYPELHQLLGNIYMKRNQLDKSAYEYRKALDSSKCTFSLLYICSNCRYRSNDWSGRCDSCRKWNTYQLNLSS